MWLTERDFDQWTEEIGQCGVGFTADDVIIVRFPYAISDPAHIVQAAAKSMGAW